MLQVKLPLDDKAHPKGNKFVKGVKIKSTVDSNLKTAQQSTWCIYHVWPCYYKILETGPLRSCSYAFQKYSVNKKKPVKR